jgi:acylphosphatase
MVGKKTALKLQLKGYAKNLPNGNVEIVVVGEEENLEIFIGKCWIGPEISDVRKILKEKIETEDFNHFDIRF